jgi:dephospho-CoA kinase
MRTVGLTGGIGSCKSTVARLLVGHGAHVVDADAIAREVVEPGEPALEAIRERFGTGVVAADGTLDRPALARIVFAEEAARRDLEAITHPAIRARIEERFAEHAAAEADEAGERVVVLDHPLLVETGLADAFETVVVVTAPSEVRVRRLVDRGMTEHDARARMASQATDSERRAVATHVLDNGGSEADLAAAVDALWESLAGAGDAAGAG